jgi:hypothetical protein
VSVTARAGELLSGVFGQLKAYEDAVDYHPTQAPSERVALLEENLWRLEA